ncbi:MAG: nicotinate phosphoribosyltransferase [Cytophagales bacterium]|nr:nicotinate phosphoribosyltransferase [Cytophagales bacterium]
MDFLEIYYTDVYKTGHKPMLPEGSTLMNSNFTPRSGKHANFPNSKGVIAAGMQKTVRQIHEDWNKNFFQRPVEEIEQFGRDLTAMLMLKEPFNVSHFKELHELGYLPIVFKAIPEGSFIPYKIPMFTIQNTKPLSGKVFDWIVNYLETILSAESWQIPTSATLVREFRKLGKEWLTKTDPDNLWLLDYQFHDFSMRGMGGKSACINSGLGFAMGSRGSDTLPVIPATRKFYDYPTTEVPINSVIASEHAIMCSLTGFFLKQKDGTWDKIGELEIETFRYMLQTFPTGILSLVSDTWDLWRVITDYCAQLKDEILARDGKLVIRPDSGDPVDIITGTFRPSKNKVPKLEIDLEFSDYDVAELDTQLFFDRNIDIFSNVISDMNDEVEDGGGVETLNVLIGKEVYTMVVDFDSEWIPDWSMRCNVVGDLSLESVEKYVEPKTPVATTVQEKGVIELLWDIFGGTVNAQGYKVLDPHIGAIYGDSINLERAEQMFIRLADKGFASSNIVLGVGSYSLQFVTRDTHGFAQKATYIELGEDCGVEIFKDPITDDGTKKSAKGLLRVDLVDGVYTLKDQCTKEEEQGGVLQVIFEDGKFYNQVDFETIRKRLDESI